jgi:chromate reductase
MQYHWRMSMTFLGAHIFGTPEIFVGNAQTKFDKDTLALTDQPTIDIVKTQLAAFDRFVRRMPR